MTAPNILNPAAPYDPVSAAPSGGENAGFNAMLAGTTNMPDSNASLVSTLAERGAKGVKYAPGPFAYPPNLVLDEDTLARLRSYLSTEMLNHYAERTTYADRLQQDQSDYWSEAVKTRASYPFPGASRIIVPLTAIAVETFHARSMTTLFSLPQFTYVKSKNSQFSNVERGLERLLDTEITGDAESLRNLDSMILELEKYGTGIGKSEFEQIRRKAVRYNALNQEEPFYVTTKRGSTIKAVSVGRYLMPFAYQDAQEAPWCGEEHEKSPFVIKNLVENGFFYGGVYEQLWNWVVYSTAGSNNMERKFTSTQEDLEDRTPQWPDTILWQEVWLSFDVDGDGQEEEIVVHFHYLSGSFLSIRYNWYNNLRRPYRKGNFVPVEHRWNGIGICQQNEQFQREITTIHRQRLDAGTIANVPMLKIAKLSGISPDEPMFPGKKWFVDSLDQIEAFRLSDVPASAFSNEQAALIYSQQRTAINDVTMGMPQVGTPGTATGDLARLQEGNKRFDYIYRNEKMLVKELTIDTLCNIKQFGPRNIEFFQYDDDGSIVQDFIANINPSFIENHLVLDIGPVGQQQNRILNQQKWGQLSQYVNMYIDGLYKILAPMMQQNPQLLQELSMQSVEAVNEVMRQVLENFDVRNMDRILFTPGRMLPDNIQQLMSQPEVMSTLGSGVGANASQIAGLLGRGNSNAAPTNPFTILASGSQANAVPS